MLSNDIDILMRACRMDCSRPKGMNDSGAMPCKEFHYPILARWFHLFDLVFSEFSLHLYACITSAHMADEEREQRVRRALAAHENDRRGGTVHSEYETSGGQSVSVSVSVCA